LSSNYLRTLLAPTDPGPAEEREKPGGFGLFLIKSAMNDLRYRNLDNGNELTMIKSGVIGGSRASN
jgi:anti-sigma regulatory factor (Ser/Thr protein kinase)